jgi:hypothetical protein
LSNNNEVLRDSILTPAGLHLDSGLEAGWMSGPGGSKSQFVIVAHFGPVEAEKRRFYRDLGDFKKNQCLILFSACESLVPVTGWSGDAEAGPSPFDCVSV